MEMLACQVVAGEGDLILQVQSVIWGQRMQGLKYTGGGFI